MKKILGITGALLLTGCALPVAVGPSLVGLGVFQMRNAIDGCSVVGSALTKAGYQNSDLTIWEKEVGATRHTVIVVCEKDTYMTTRKLEEERKKWIAGNPRRVVTSRGDATTTEPTLGMIKKIFGDRIVAEKIYSIPK